MMLGGRLGAHRARMPTAPVRGCSQLWDLFGSLQSIRDKWGEVGKFAQCPPCFRVCLFLQVAGVGLFSGNAARLCPVTQRPRRALGLNKPGPLTRTAETRSEAVHGKSEQQHPARGTAPSTSKLCKAEAGEETKTSRRVCAAARGFWHKRDVPHQL